jgi:hypothetical protein
MRLRRHLREGVLTANFFCRFTTEPVSCSSNTTRILRVGIVSDPAYNGYKIRWNTIYQAGTAFVIKKCSTETGTQPRFLGCQVSDICHVSRRTNGWLIPVPCIASSGHRSEHCYKRPHFLTKESHSKPRAYCAPDREWGLELIMTIVSCTFMK